MKITNSERGSFQRCRLRWHYEYIKSIEPKRKNLKFLFGSAFHKFLEIWYGTGGDYDKALKAMYDYIKLETREWNEVDEVAYEDMMLLLKGISEHYVKWYASDLKNWKVLETEKTYTYKLPNGVDYEFTIDMLIEDEHGQKWIVDHKTASSIEWFRSNTPLDRQISLYIGAYRSLFPEHQIAGMIYNIVKKDMPERPKVLKDGSLSKAKNQTTTYELYVKALRDLYNLKYPQQEIPWETYIEEFEEILETLQKRPNDYFYREKVIRNGKELKGALNEIVAVSNEKKGLLSHIEKGKMDYIYRNPTKDCSWDCSYKDLCVASMDGSDVDYLIDTLYKPKEVK